MTIRVHPYQLTETQRKNSLRRTLWEIDKANCASFKDAFKRIIHERFGDNSEIILEVFFKNNAGHKIDYSGIKNIKLRKQVRDFILDSYPVIF